MKQYKVSDLDRDSIPYDTLVYLVSDVEELVKEIKAQARLARSSYGGFRVNEAMAYEECAKRLKGD